MFKKMILAAVVAMSLTIATAQVNNTRSGRTTTTQGNKPQGKSLGSYEQRKPDVHANCTNTGYTIDYKGKTYQVYVTNKNKRAFIILNSPRTGNDYRKYLGDEVSKAVAQ